MEFLDLIFTHIPSKIQKPFYLNLFLFVLLEKHVEK